MFGQVYTGFFVDSLISNDSGPIQCSLFPCDFIGTFSQLSLTNHTTGRTCVSKKTHKSPSRASLILNFKAPKPKGPQMVKIDTSLQKVFKTQVVSSGFLPSQELWLNDPSPPTNLEHKTSAAGRRNGAHARPNSKHSGESP